MEHMLTTDLARLLVAILTAVALGVLLLAGRLGAQV